MKIEKIKPIPQKILAKIKSTDKRIGYKPCGKVRFYAYLTKNDGELCKVTVAAKEYKRTWYCKQVAVHGLHSDKGFCRDIEYSFMGGYRVGWYAEGITPNPRYWEDGKWYTADDKYYNPYAHLINPEFVYQYQEFKYCACELYKGDDVIQYLRTYEKYPQAEMLVKLGLSRYADSKQILEKIGNDKHFRKWLSVNHSELEKEWYISTVLQAYKQRKPLQEVQIYEQEKKALNKPQFAPIRNLFNGEYNKYFDYVSKQRITNSLYADYLTACQYLGMDMAEDKNRFPHDFKHWHDVRIDEYETAKAMKDEQERAELYKEFAKIAEKYAPMQRANKGDFVVIIARSPLELMNEGKALHHCVGKMGYDKKFIREQSLIFFIRSKDNTETPLATVEYSIEKKKILQCHADHNSTPDQAVMDYVNNVWLPYANRKISKIVA